MLSHLKPLRLVLVAILVAIALPAAADAQATRTWVSGVGDDANPCSRTAPCKTFAGSISKTAASGEINCLDPGGYGAVTITKAISILCQNTVGGVLVSGTDGIVVNAGPNDKVVLRGLDLNGLNTGLSGVRVLQADSVIVRDTDVYGFSRSAVDFRASNAGSEGLVQDSSLHNNAGDGVLVAPPSTGGTTVAVRNSEVRGNACGVVATSHLPDPANNFAANCGTDLTGTGGTAEINVFNSSLIDHDGGAGAGVFTNGSGALIRIGGNEITGNTTGLKTLDTGAAGGIFSFGDNYIAGNGTDGSPTGLLVPDTEPSDPDPVVDTTPPDTELTSEPGSVLKVKKGKGKGKKRRAVAKAKFSFESSEPGATFDCRLDNAGYQPCTSPRTETLGKGDHVFRVRSIDPSGNADFSSEKWRGEVIVEKAKKKRKR